MRAATAEAAREVAEFKAMREAQLRRESPEVRLHQALPRAGTRCRCHWLTVCAVDSHILLQAEALRRRSDAVKAATEAKLVALEAEYARNKDLVTGMLLQVVLSIDNPYARK